jgi:hypothetical protein
MASKCAFPSLPTLEFFLPGLPSWSLPTFKLPSLPDLPVLPDLPTLDFFLPELPSWSLPTFKLPALLCPLDP